MVDHENYNPNSSHELAWEDRLFVTPALATAGTAAHAGRIEGAFAHLAGGGLLMMGDNPALPKMPAVPTLMDFLKLRIRPDIVEHQLQSATQALREGHNEKVVLACLLHDISVGGLINTEHAYWGAQLVEPYVDEEVSWAIRYHGPLRFIPDLDAGYAYPDLYVKFFGSNYRPPAHVWGAYEEVRDHRWYSTARTLTVNDVYSWDPASKVNLEDFTDIIGRNFRQPKEGLGFDGSPTAHMWRSMIWPNNTL